MSPACLFFPSSANEKQSSLSVLWDPGAMQAIIWLASWEAEAHYDTGCVKKKIKKRKEKEVMNKESQWQRF